MAVLAVKSVKLTNSRGFCVELATAMTVVLASRFGLPGEFFGRSGEMDGETKK